MFLETCLHARYISYEIEMGLNPKLSGSSKLATCLFACTFVLALLSLCSTQNLGRTIKMRDERVLASTRKLTRWHHCDSDHSPCPASQEIHQTEQKRQLLGSLLTGARYNTSNTTVFGSGLLSIGIAMSTGGPSVVSPINPRQTYNSSLQFYRQATGTRSSQGLQTGFQDISRPLLTGNSMPRSTDPIYRSLNITTNATSPLQTGGQGFNSIPLIPIPVPLGVVPPDVIPPVLPDPGLPNGEPDEPDPDPEYQSASSGTASATNGTRSATTSFSSTASSSATNATSNSPGFSSSSVPVNYTSSFTRATSSNMTITSVPLNATSATAAPTWSNATMTNMTTSAINTSMPSVIESYPNPTFNPVEAAVAAQGLARLYNETLPSLDELLNLSLAIQEAALNPSGSYAFMPQMPTVNPFENGGSSVGTETGVPSSSQKTSNPTRTSSTSSSSTHPSVLACGATTSDKTLCPASCPWSLVSGYSDDAGGMTNTGICLSPNPTTSSKGPKKTSTAGCKGAGSCTDSCTCLPVLSNIKTFYCASPDDYSKRKMLRRSRTERGDGGGRKGRFAKRGNDAVGGGRYEGTEITVFETIEAMPCACNTTYLSEACCDSRTGIVFEGWDKRLVLARSGSTVSGKANKQLFWTNSKQDLTNRHSQ